jgi:hypothetical protein
MRRGLFGWEESCGFQPASHKTAVSGVEKFRPSFDSLCERAYLNIGPFIYKSVDRSKAESLVVERSPVLDMEHEHRPRSN